MQTRLQSIIEAVTNTIISFIIGMATNYIALPMFGFAVSVGQAGWLTLIFTVVSFIRQYILRRVFNNLHAPKLAVDSPAT